MHSYVTCQSKSGALEPFGTNWATESFHILFQWTFFLQRYWFLINIPNFCFLFLFPVQRLLSLIPFRRLNRISCQKISWQWKVLHFRKFPCGFCLWVYAILCLTYVKNFTRLRRKWDSNPRTEFSSINGFRDRPIMTAPAPLRKLAEAEGFEPSGPLTGTNTLAGCRFRPLSHTSEKGGQGGIRTHVNRNHNPAPKPLGHLSHFFVPPMRFGLISPD